MSLTAIMIIFLLSTGNIFFKNYGLDEILNLYSISIRRRRECSIESIIYS
jgi:hypothetical protein